MVNGKSLLLVDDDDSLREVLRDQLELHDEFTIQEASSAADALEIAKDSNYDLLILDVGLPDMDGREACRLIRRTGFNAPIIMLAGADTEVGAILGIDCGADDYVTKPFKLGVLLARIRAQLRQHARSEDAAFNIGRYSFRPSAKMLIDSENGDQKTRLTEKETAILKYLFRAGDNVIGREVLLNEVWGYNSGVTTHTLETHVYRLRQKIERDPANAEFLVTVPGGYRLVP
ncbi:MAG: DNA-binding response regulator [Rhodospirillaceae bacterium]|nr:DNA-binding response regulator [Rhodospirillaceae bacterium]MAI49620.1 DNA-binding response regulator [Rhodospirillaceae bacterium]|tara:strand:- start:294 stop:986 length:693 start_codon:yes stop_codon:yes gene_type:complete